jgi:uncharacterized protein (TIGR03083 family)
VNSTAPAPLAPTLCGHLFRPLGDELVALLRGLPSDAWNLPTVCRAWQVRDIAAHLLDSGMRRLSFGRDALPLLPPSRPIAGYRDLVDFLDQLNAEWVTAARRLSPRILADLLAWLEPQLGEHLASMDPHGTALFSVAWAGEESSSAWFDVARELTERWLHQQQIRLAVGAPPLDDAETSAAVFDTLLRALPHTYAGLEAAVGSNVSIAIGAARLLTYTLERANGGWILLGGTASPPRGRRHASVRLDDQTAWLMLSKGISPDEARERATVAGDAALLDPFFGALAVMAQR